MKTHFCQFRVFFQIFCSKHDHANRFFVIMHSVKSLKPSRNTKKSSVKLVIYYGFFSEDTDFCEYKKHSLGRLLSYFNSTRKLKQFDGTKSIAFIFAYRTARRFDVRKSVC